MEKALGEGRRIGSIGSAHSPMSRLLGVVRTAFTPAPPPPHTHTHSNPETLACPLGVMMEDSEASACAIAMFLVPVGPGSPPPRGTFPQWFKESPP